MTIASPIDQEYAFPDVGFFEGTEKLLEVIFSPSKTCIANGLRSIKKDEWQDLLTHVRCTIVGEDCSGATFDSFVLSESSLFVSTNRFILKTCGTTTLLPAVPLLLKLAHERCGFSSVENLFFSRKSFLRPSEQLAPHSCFDDEVAYLRKFFGENSGLVINRPDWHLFVLNQSVPLAAKESRKYIFNDGLRGQQVKIDAGATDLFHDTLEIMMNDLDPTAMAQFYRGPWFKSAKETTISSGIADIFPGAVTNEVMFDPCGYSVNGILDTSEGGIYFTIHVTPQPECSYVSFETNAPDKAWSGIVEYVLKLFRPGKFSISILHQQASHQANKCSCDDDKQQALKPTDRVWPKTLHFPSLSSSASSSSSFSSLSENQHEAETADRSENGSECDDVLLSATPPSSTPSDRLSPISLDSNDRYTGDFDNACPSASIFASDMAGDNCAYLHQCLLRPDFLCLDWYFKPALAADGRYGLHYAHFLRQL